MFHLVTAEFQERSRESELPTSLTHWQPTSLCFFHIGTDLGKISFQLLAGELAPLLPSPFISHASFS
jgi:hypothetical protein